jgi:Tol biopolymer transport system component/DNA-binding winged helix-turn-helix (wHTH) protein
MDAVSTPKVVRFGTYEVDLRSGELRKNGLKVRLTGQPFQILAILLERPGELVTREELQKRLWPGDTFVDFDRGLNAAVNRVREALGDSAENPRFVETLPRRGYRFIGQVEGPPPASSTESQSAVDGQRNRSAGRGWKIGIAAGSVILLTFSLLFPTIARRVLRVSQPQLFEAVPLTALPGQEISPSFSPDGSQVAFGWNGENHGAGFDLYVKVIGTDKPLRLTNHPALWLGVAWSPDGRSIAVNRLAIEELGIFLVPALGGPERKLVSTSNFAFWAPDAALSWSPDGKQLAFADHFPSAGYSTQIFLLSLNTLERKRMETGCDWTFGPGFSPLGDSLVYLCLRDDGDYSLNLLDLRTGKNKRLFAGLLRIRDPAWTRDGARIIFSYGSGNTPFAGAGGNLWQITPGQTGSPEKMPVGHDATSAIVSSSGNRLAYVQTQINGNIWRVDLDDVKAKARILVTSTREQYAPLISPDGRRIVFTSNRSGTDEIWVCDSDGSNTQQLTSFGGALTGTPRWSPDGREIVFDSRAGGEANVYVIDANGGVPRRLETGTRMNSLPSWSHDGKWIYFASGLTHSRLTLWRVAATGGHAVQLTKTASSMPIESPDGQYVYFVRFTEGKFRLWRMRPDGSGESMVKAMPPLNSDGYEWWPFESGIYFYAHKGGNAEIDFLDLPSSRVRRISTLDKPPAPWLGGLSVSPDGKWFLYSRIDETASDLMLVENFH